MIKVAHELPNSATLHHLGVKALYLIATLPNSDTWQNLSSRALYLFAESFSKCDNVVAFRNTPRRVE
ncbi:TPA: hypothetical protein U1383_001083 [Streptococcus suis]|nr:hypothetical protein [Streptococcus suis]HEM5327077.1 hypothetical protein [Streptococcus suis]